jgi:hypothetical protein
LALPQTSEKLLEFKSYHAESLWNFVSIHKEPNKDSFYVQREKEYLDLQKELQCLGKNLAALKSMLQRRNTTVT